MLNPWTGTNGNLFRTDGFRGQICQWQFFTGTNATSSTQKFRIYTNVNTSDIQGTQTNDQNITLEASVRDMLFNAGGEIERMRILGLDQDLISFGYGYARAGNVGIGCSHPLSMLQIGGEASIGAGTRSWMNIGTNYVSESAFDNMYVGLKNIGPDQNQAIISWGNNPSQQVGNVDRLRFIFTAAPGNGIASTQDGLEVARMWANNVGDSRLGVGDFFSSNSDPQNTLEIKASSGSAYWGQPGGSSGLRFTFLTSNAVPVTNPGTGYLSVDTNGDVIYVNSTSTGGAALAHNGTSQSTLDISKVALGQNLNEVGNPGALLNNREIPLNDQNLFFSSLPNATSLTNNVKIGGNTTPVPIKLTVLNDVENIGALIISNSPIYGGTNRYGIIGRSENSYISMGVTGMSSDAVTSIGVYGTATDGTSSTIGVQGRGFSTLAVGNTYGGYFVANSNTPNENYGVQGFSNGSPNINIGGYFSSLGGNLAIGVYGEANSSDPGAVTYAGYFAGNIISPGPSVPSDIQFKTNINALQDANAILNSLNPVTYNYLQSGNASYMHFPTNNQLGLIAQEVETVLPEIVSQVTHPEQHDTLGNITIPSFNYKTVKYEALIPVLIKGHQEQNAKIDSLMNVNVTINNYNDSLVQAVSDLNARLTLLENCLSNILPALCQANQAAVMQTPEETQEYMERTINITLSNRNNIVLNQNVPNPFAESTVISFSIPSTVLKAQIHFYDGSGKLINSVEIMERGSGTLNVFANDLSTGVYTYSLVADGQIISTKRMMKQ